MFSKYCAQICFLYIRVELLTVSRWGWNCAFTRHVYYYTYYFITIFVLLQFFSICLDIFTNAVFARNFAERLQKYVGKPSDTDSIKSQISSKTSRGKKDNAKRHHIAIPIILLLFLSYYNFLLFVWIYS